jgi:hypothetical protein
VNEQRLAAAQRGGGLLGQVSRHALSPDAGQGGAIGVLAHGHGQVLAGAGVLGVGAFLHGRDDWPADEALVGARPGSRNCAGDGRYADGFRHAGLTHVEPVTIEGPGH